MIPPYGLGEEDWDRNAWGSTEFDNLFKKIQAVDQRTLTFVMCFGTITILAEFQTVAKVWCYFLFWLFLKH